MSFLDRHHLGRWKIPGTFRAPSFFGDGLWLAALTAIILLAYSVVHWISGLVFAFF